VSHTHLMYLKVPLSITAYVNVGLVPPVITWSWYMELRFTKVVPVAGYVHFKVLYNSLFNIE